MRLREFERDDLEAVHSLVLGTIDACYTGIYPPRAVAFFKDFHSREAILQRFDSGRVIVLQRGERILATGSLAAEEISGVFVAAECQGEGMGSSVMDDLEANALLGGLRAVRLAVSLPSRGFYEQRGYRIVQTCSLDVGEGQSLDYWQAEKVLGVT